MLPQVETEACLEARLVAQGGKVERGLELVSVESSGVADEEGDEGKESEGGVRSQAPLRVRIRRVEVRPRPKAGLEVGVGWEEVLKGVGAWLAGQDGTEETVECRYVVGCDGAHR